MAITYELESFHPISVYFPQTTAKLPVLCKNGLISLVTWGRRPHQLGQLPLGGWARLDDVEDQRWLSYFPRPVKLPIQQFMEQDIEGKSHWFALTAGQYVQGLLARYDKEMRVYIVTVVPERDDAVFTRWPRLVSSR